MCQLTLKTADSAGLRHCFQLNNALTRLDSSERIAEFVAENVRSFDAVNVATACHRLAKMQSQTRQRRVETQPRSQPCGPGRDAGQAISALLARASEIVNSFKPQNVANLMWALATLGVEPGAELVTVMSRRAVASAGEFKPQNVSNLMWALATLGVEPGADLAMAMSRQAVAIAGEFTPQDVSNLLWTLAVIYGDDQACSTLWMDAISYLVAALGRNPWNFPASNASGPYERFEHCQLHQVLLCMALEGLLLPGLDLAGLLGSGTVGMFRQAFEGAPVRSSKLQVRVYR